MPEQFKEYGEERGEDKTAGERMLDNEFQHGFADLDSFRVHFETQEIKEGNLKKSGEPKGYRLERTPETEKIVREYLFNKQFRTAFCDIHTARTYFQNNSLTDEDLTFARPGQPEEGELDVDYYYLVKTPKTKKIVEESLWKKVE